MARPRGTDASGTTTRTRILAAAMRQIADRGYGGMRLADVAVDAGVSLGLVQHYFRTRTGLLQAAFDAGTEVNLREARAIADGPGTPSERLAGLLRWGTGELDPADGSWEFWFEFWLAALREPELSLRNRAGDQGWQDTFRTVLADGVADGSFAPNGTPEQVAAFQALRSKYIDLTKQQINLVQEISDSREQLAALITSFKKPATPAPASAQSGN